MDETIETSSGYEIVNIRDDGTFVIMLNGAEYHVTPDYCPELWASVKAQVEASKE